MLLSGKVILVTGSTTGIGESTARRAVAEGAQVMVHGRNEERAKAVAADLGDAAAYVVGDVADPAVCERAVQATVAHFGRIDGLVNNAGVTRDTLLLRMKDDDWEAPLKTNLGGAFLCTQAALKPMLKQRAGRIVNIASVVGVTGNPGQANYAASKAGLIGFTKSVAREVASRGITCNAVTPGYIETEMTAAMTDKAREAMLSAIPLARAGRGEDVAGAVVFLLSESASYVTGQVLGVDGGFHM